ncbi:hypothetical protein AGOR_G00060820 [Albula goreensis]|uniref:BED-type domain-containing protein n=1 Tax=Albula goreensis TaxID=1534307 RepID=A0A8T3DU58_9TELE|nr:hypothetical protein AGOR_G00060820 [Albula goreensis]
MESKGAEGSPSDLNLVAHPRAKSKVWKYFGFDTDADGCILHWKKIYCRICMTQIAYSGNTSNLSYHLEKNHPDEFCEFVKSNTEQMREAFATAFSKLKPESSHWLAQETLTMKQNPEHENRKHIDLTSAVISFVCEGMFPVSVVDEPTFKVLLKTADPSDRVTCWVSTLAMLQRLKEQQFVIASVLVEDSNNHHLMLEATEWSMVDGLVELLQPFRLVADMMISCRYPTISMVKPLLHMLLNTTLKVKDADLKEVSMAKEVIAKVLSSTYQQTPEIDMFLNVATFIDPRYKKLPFLSPIERSQVESRVVEEAKVLLEKRREECSGQEETSQFADEPPIKRQAVGTPPPTSNTSNPLAVIFCQSGAEENQEELHAQVMEEVSNFKSQKVLGLNEDPLRWWSDRMALFPTLPKVLQKYWCIPATSVLPHRLFTSSGNVLSGKRNRLAPAHVDQQVFLYENLRSCYDAEPTEEDEGEWGVEQDQGLAAGDALSTQTNVMNTKDIFT